MAEYIGLTFEDGFHLLGIALAELTEFAASHLEVTVLGILTLLVVWNFIIRFRA